MDGVSTSTGGEGRTSAALAADRYGIFGVRRLGVGVARHHDINANQLFTCRQRYRTAGGDAALVLVRLEVPVEA